MLPLTVPPITTDPTRMLAVMVAPCSTYRKPVETISPENVPSIFRESLNRMTPLKSVSLPSVVVMRSMPLWSSFLGMASLRLHHEHPVPVLGRRVLDVVLAAGVVDLGRAVLGIYLERPGKRVPRLVELHELVQLAALREQVEDLLLLLGDHGSAP